MKKVLKSILLISLLIALSVFCPVFGWVLFFWLLCGLLDVCRHNPLTASVFKRYFMGNGIAVFLMSPLNVFTDIISQKNLIVWKLEDYPEDQRREISTIIALFVQRKEEIRQYMEEQSGESKRSMLFFKWYGENYSDIIPEFNQSFKFIKTIGVSVFKPECKTSWHFGPTRINFRVLYNLFPGKASYIETQGQKYYWSENPFFSFDDTVLHQSVNNSKEERYCAFIDVQRPSSFNFILSFLNQCMCQIFKFKKAIFYKNWTLIK